MTAHDPECAARLQSFRNVSALVRHSIFPGTPSRIHPVGRFLKDRFDTANLVLFDLEHFGNFPGERPCRTPGDVSSIRRLEVPRIPGRMIEEREAESQPPFRIDGDKAAIPDARDEV